MKDYLLIIMDNEPAITEMTWCDTVSQAKMIVDEWVYGNGYKYETDAWLGNPDYPYRPVSSHHNDDVGSHQFSIEIMPVSLIHTASEHLDD